MKAVRLRSFGVPAQVAQVEELSLEPLAPGEALVRVLAAPINPSDVLTLQGQYGTLPKLPAIPGNEGVGRVVEISGESALKPGDLVFLPLGGGTWCTHLKAPASRLIPAPAGADVLQLSMLSINPPTAELLLKDYVTLAPGDWVLQNAANSAVGRYLVPLAKRAGLRTINVVRRAELEPELKALGADEVLVDGDDLAKRVRKLTGGAFVKLAIDAVGGEATQRLGDSTAPGGTVVNYGVMGGDAPRLSPAALIFRDVQLRGFWLTRALPAMTSEARKDLFRRLAALVADGTLAARIDSTYPLERIGDALARAMTEARGGKVLLVPDDGA